MSNIDLSTGLAIKADINKLYADIIGGMAKFRENKRYDKAAYDELLEKYASLVTSVESIRNQLNELIDDAQTSQIPDEKQIRAMDAMLGLMGAKKQDGSLDFEKLVSLNETFGNKAN